MSSTNNDDDANEDDLEELLAQADSFISSGGGGGGDGDGKTSYVVEGFSIDDDEDEEDDEGVLDVPLDSPEPHKATQTLSTESTDNATAGGAPPPKPPVEKTTEDPLLHPLHEDVVGTNPSPNQNNFNFNLNNNNNNNNNSAGLSPGQTTTTGDPSGGGGGGGGHHFPHSVASAFQNLGVAEYEQQFKAQTSRFASNFANLAQRVASAASGNNTNNDYQNSTMTINGSGSVDMYQQQNNSNNNNNNYPPPMSVVPHTQMQHQLSSSSSGGGNHTPTTPSSSSSAPNSGPGPTLLPPNFELDTEQKTALVERHVGKLLPGERVIMFLTNLLHVGDSSGFSYSASHHHHHHHHGSPSSSGTSWCCAMTYYRLILFGATHESVLFIMNNNNNNTTTTNNNTDNDGNQGTPPPVLQHAFHPPSTWNASCWPPAPPTVLEMPLATMEKVEKTVYTPAAALPSPSSQTQSRGAAGSGGGGAGGGGGVTTLMGLQVWAKEGRYWRITTPSYADTTRAHQALLTYAFPGRRNLGYLFAFESKRHDVVQSVVTDPNTGQKTVTLPLTRKRFDPIREYQRQLNRYSTSTSSGNNNGDPSQPQPPPQPWKIYGQLNSQYQLCRSYPSVLVGPASLDDQNPDAVRLLQNCAAFRSEQRLPSLTWASGMDGASLWRSSQPKIGLQGNRSSADELVLKHIMEAAKSANALREQPLPVRLDANLLQVFTGVAENNIGNSHWVREAGCALKILDLRPRSAAMANRTGGYGYENTSNYPGTTLQFCNIGNIHAVRDAYQKMTALCLNMTNASDVSWGSALEDTKWLSFIRLILAASWEAAFWVTVHRMPVLLHCSHGWDRTSQVSALAQLMLDPYYRTLEGFACLVEKDFMSFGHPFHTRCAHGEGKGGVDGGGVHHQDGASGPGGLSSSGGNSSAADEGQISPIFLQFLDCAWQLVNQYPECFEFTADYLLELSNHIYSCRFGNMLCDTERERELVAGIRQRTYSLWDHLEQDPNDPSSNSDAHTWRNKSYDPSPHSGGGVLLMPLPTLLRNVTLWAERHAQYGPKPTQRWRNSVQSLLVAQAQAADASSAYTIS